MKRFILFAIIIAIFSQIQVFAQTDEILSQQLVDAAKNARFPNTIQSDGKIARSNLTSINIKVFQNWDKLSKDAKQYFQVYLPDFNDFEEYYDTEDGFFRIWFNRYSNNSVPSDDDNLNNIPDYVELVAESFEIARAMYIEAGLNMPYIKTEEQDNKYNVFLSNYLCGSGVFGYVDIFDIIGDNPDTPDLIEIESAMSYAVLRNNYRNFSFDPDYYKVAIPITAAHEFMHSVQFSYAGTYLHDFLMEMASTWAEEWVVTGNYDCFDYLSKLMNAPDIALNYKDEEGISSYDSRWYSAWLFLRYFTDLHDAEVVKKMYVNMITQNEFNSIDNAFKCYETDFSSMLKDFYISLALLSQKEQNYPYIFSMADLIREVVPSVKYEKTYTLSNQEIIHDSEFDGNKRLMRFSGDFIKIDSDTAFSIVLEPKSQNDTLSLILIKMDDDIDPDNISIIEAEKSNGVHKIHLGNIADYNKFSVLVLNTNTRENLQSAQYFLRINPEVSNIEESNVSINETKVYPNPFVNDFSISIVLRSSDYVSIELYSIAGQRISSIFEGFLESGNRTLHFSDAQLNSGAYILKVVSSNQTNYIRINKID